MWNVCLIVDGEVERGELRVDFHSQLSILNAQLDFKGEMNSNLCQKSIFSPTFVIEQLCCNFEFHPMNSSPAIAILVSGLPGSGKTYFAKRLAPAIGAAYFGSDIMRKSVTPDRTYTPSEKVTVYNALLERMVHSLRASQTVVIDATFYKKDLREEFIKAAQSANSKVYWIEVRANKSVIRERLGKPREDSTADFGVYLKLRDQYEPIKEAHLTLHSDKASVGEMIAETQKWLEENR